jgi:hypothetical protein
MVARATEANSVNGKLRVSRIVYTSTTIYQGQGVVATSETHVSPATASTDLCIGVAAETEDGTWPATAGDTIVVALLGSPEIVKVQVGTGGTATAGALAKAGTIGVTNATVNGASAVCAMLGQFVDSGTAVDLVGLNLACGHIGIGN